MLDRLAQGGTESYLKSLYDLAISGNVEAGGELSNIALGGNQFARDLVNKMDEKLGNGPKQDAELGGQI